MIDGKKIAVISVPHSGTHFMKWHLLKDMDPYVSHCFPSTREHWLAQAHQCDVVIVPLRHPHAIVKSWVNRERRLAEELPEYMQIMSDVVIPYLYPYVLPIDLPTVRDQVLEDINLLEGLKLDAQGWPVIRQAEAYKLPGKQPTEYEFDAVPFLDPYTRYYHG